MYRNSVRVILHIARPKARAQLYGSFDQTCMCRLSTHVAENEEKM